MEAELADLAARAAAALAESIATDGWRAARKAVTGLWARHDARKAGLIETGLDSARADVEEAATEDAQEAVEAVALSWEGQFKALLRARPEAAAELRRILEEELAPLAAAAVAAGGPVVTQTATVGAGGTSIQIGGSVTSGGTLSLGTGSPGGAHHSAAARPSLPAQAAVPQNDRTEVDRDE